MSGRLYERREIHVYKAVKDGELEIDKSGFIWRVKRRWNLRGKQLVIKDVPRIRAETLSTKGYLQVAAGWGGVSYTAYAHRVVWMHFKGEIPEGLTINHINGVPTDNRIVNLELATMSDQAKHASRVLNKCHFSKVKGEAHHNAKLTEEGVREIRRLIACGQSTTAIASVVGVSVSTVQRIKYRRLWGWLE